jgi:hypothetical protein
VKNLVYNVKNCFQSLLTNSTYCATTPRRSWPEPWQLFNDRGVAMVLECEAEPSNREVAEALNEAAGVKEVAGFNRKAVNISRDDDVIT